MKISDRTAWTKNSWRLLATGKPAGSVLKETIAVSATMSISVQNDTSESVSEFFHATR